MPYTPIRRDFVFNMKCHVCPQPLSSNTAFILRDDEGLEHPFGETCAGKLLGEDGPRRLRQVPDFTKAAPGRERDGPGGGGGNGGGGRGDGHQAERRLCRAITYLLLRQEKLAHIPAAGYAEFEAYYDSFRRTGELTEDSIRHILNVEHNRAGQQFGFDNLQAIYAYDCCITRALQIVEPGRRQWLTDVQRTLRRFLNLSEPQARGVENWLSRIPGHQPLSPRGFQWAWRVPAQPQP